VTRFRLGQNERRAQTPACLAKVYPIVLQLPAELLGLVRSTARNRFRLSHLDDAVADPLLHGRIVGPSRDAATAVLEVSRDATRKLAFVQPGVGRGDPWTRIDAAMVLARCGVGSQLGRDVSCLTRSLDAGIHR
jgi:hypothetical protein